MPLIENPDADNPFTRGHQAEARRLRQRDATVEKSRFLLGIIQRRWARDDRAKRPPEKPFHGSGPFWNPK